jgi:hypothetical protein
VEARAAVEPRKPRDLLTDRIRQPLEPAATGGDADVRRSPLPVINKASAGGVIPAMTTAEIQAILDEEDAEEANRLAGR